MYCVITGCHRPRRKRDWCDKHYQRWLKYHDDPAVERPYQNEPPSTRFWRNVEQGPSCWKWTGGVTHDGYGYFFDGAKQVRAHRFSYQERYGELAPDLQVDHLCRNRLCVNPTHMELVTNRENQLRGVTIGAKNAAKTACAKGHEFNEENTYWRPDGKGRQCRTCIATYSKKQKVG